MYSVQCEWTRNGVPLTWKLYPPLCSCIVLYLRCARWIWRSVFYMNFFHCSYVSNSILVRSDSVELVLHPCAWYARVSQMKTLTMCYVVIYWTQKVHNDLIFLCSLHCHLSATLQTMGIIVENYKTVELWFEFLSHF